MSIGALRMHRGLSDHGALIGPQAERVVDAKRPIEMVVSPLHPSEGTHGMEGKVDDSISLTSTVEVKWFGGKHDDGSPGNETV